MDKDILLAIITGVFGLLLALVTPGTALLFATLKKRGLEVTALERSEVERIAREAILFAEEQARKVAQAPGPEKLDHDAKMKEALQHAAEEAKRARVRTPSSSTIEAQLPIVRASFLPPKDELVAALGSEQPYAGALPPPPPVPSEDRVTNAPPRRKL